MDFDTFITLALILLYLVFQVLGSRKKQRKRTAAKGQPLPPRAETDTAEVATADAEPTLDDALREIRKALGMEDMQEPPPAPSLPRAPEPARPATPASPTQPEFRPVPTHYADADFEGRPTAFGALPSIHKKEPALRPLRTTRPQRVTPSKSKTPPLIAEPATRPPGGRPDSVLRQLRDPKVAREAFVMGEILGPPRAHRRR